MRNCELRSLYSCMSVMSWRICVVTNPEDYFIVTDPVVRLDCMRNDELRILYSYGLLCGVLNYDHNRVDSKLVCQIDFCPSGESTVTVSY